MQASATAYSHHHSRSPSSAPAASRTPTHLRPFACTPPPPPHTCPCVPPTRHPVLRSFTHWIAHAFVVLPPCGPLPHPLNRNGKAPTAGDNWCRVQSHRPRSCPTKFALTVSLLPLAANEFVRLSLTDLCTRTTALRFKSTALPLSPYIQCVTIFMILFRQPQRVFPALLRRSPRTPTRRPRLFCHHRLRAGIT